MSRFNRLVLHSIPSLIAISLLELVNVQVYLHGPVSKNSLLLLGWLVLQMIPGFFFGYISDRHIRRKILIIAQALGLIGGTILLIFGFELWVLAFIALTFNPMPVARAAFIDNFPEHSLVKLLAFTFLAQYIPWLFFDYIAQFDYRHFVVFILGLLALNTVFTIFWFIDNYDHNSTKHVSVFAIKTRIPVLLALGAFTLAEATFYILWAHLEEAPQLQAWQSTITYGTIGGILISMLYKRLPHISIITLCYSIGCVATLIVLIRCFIHNNAHCGDIFLNSMSFFSILGGLYLSFVGVSVIDMFGPKNKGVASAMIEFGDTIATFAAPIITFLLGKNLFGIMIVITVLYAIAAMLQRACEYSLAKVRYEK